MPIHNYKTTVTLTTIILTITIIMTMTMIIKKKLNQCVMHNEKTETEKRERQRIISLLIV